MDEPLIRRVTREETEHEHNLENLLMIMRIFVDFVCFRCIGKSTIDSPHIAY